MNITVLQYNNWEFYVMGRVWLDEKVEEILFVFAGLENRIWNTDRFERILWVIWQVRNDN